MLRDVSLSDSKCWNCGHEWVLTSKEHLCLAVAQLVLQEENGALHALRVLVQLQQELV